jgi:hypothetical protein
VPTIFAANESALLVDGQAVEGVRSLEYRRQTVRRDVYAVGSSERIGVVTGAQSVEGRIRVASASPVLDGLAGDTFFQIAAQLRHGETEVSVSFDECLLTEKSFAMGSGEHGEALYAFTATRVREEQ